MRNRTAPAAGAGPAFTNSMAKAGHALEDAGVGATCTFGPQEGGGFAVTTMRLDVNARATGIDGDEFQSLATTPHAGCEISRVLVSDMEIALITQLAA